MFWNLCYCVFMCLAFVLGFACIYAERFVCCSRPFFCCNFLSLRCIRIHEFDVVENRTFFFTSYYCFCRTFLSVNIRFSLHFFLQISFWWPARKSAFIFMRSRSNGPLFFLCRRTWKHLFWWNKFVIILYI